MRAYVTAAVLLVSTIAVADDRALVGKWDSIARDESGIGSTLQLNADGSLARTVGAMFDATYAYARDKLTITTKDPDSGKPVVTKYGVKLAGDSLVQKNGGGRGVDIVMTRRTPFDVTRPIVGTWQYAHSSGATAFVTFTEDGRELVRIPMRVDGGSWVAVGNQLTLNVAGSDPVTSTYSIEHNVLTLIDGGKEFRYRRMKY